MQRRTTHEVEVIVPKPQGEQVMYVSFDLLEEWDVRDHGTSRCTQVEVDDDTVTVTAAHLYPVEGSVATYSQQDRPVSDDEIADAMPEALRQVSQWVKEYTPDEPTSEELDKMVSDNYEPPYGWDDPNW